MLELFLPRGQIPWAQRGKVEGGKILLVVIMVNNFKRKCRKVKKD